MRTKAALAWLLKLARNLRADVACWVHGHSPMLQIEPGELYLRCSDCGRRTAGWRVTGRSQVTMNH